MKQIRKKQTMLLISFFISILVIITGIIVLFQSSIDADIKLSILLVILIISLFVVLWFKPRLFYYAQQYGFTKLKSLQGKEIKTKHNIGQQSYVNYLMKKSFKVFLSDHDLVIMHRFTRDQTNIYTKQPMLEIIALIEDPKITYSDERITKVVNMIEEDYLKNRIRFKNYTILQFKACDELDEELKDQCDQVVFDKQAGRNIIVINGCYQRNHQNVYFLYSDSFYPTAFYKYGVDLIKEII